MPDHRTYPPSPDSRLPHVGTYRRVLPVSLERLYENALDWEHLPHVHASTFQSIACERFGPWGWRASVTTATGHPLTLELRLDRECRRWITRTTEGQKVGAEIWTHAFAVSPQRTDIVVDFFMPDVPTADRVGAGAAIAKTYERLYDEDVAMMSERQRQLDRRIDAERVGEATCLGDAAALEFPLRAEHAGREYVVARIDDRLIAYVARCPHQLGPLGCVDNGTVTCSWHGYRFDVDSGACVTGQPCRLPPAPRVSVRDAKVWLER